jgi:hypothetical protein
MKRTGLRIRITTACICAPARDQIYGASFILNAAPKRVWAFRPFFHCEGAWLPKTIATICARGSKDCLARILVTSPASC